MDNERSPKRVLRRLGEEEDKDEHTRLLFYDLKEE